MNVSVSHKDKRSTGSCKNNVSDHNKLLVAQNLCNLRSHIFLDNLWIQKLLIHYEGIKLTGHP